MDNRFDDETYMRGVSNYEIEPGTAGVALEYAYQKFNLLDRCWSSIDSKAWQAFRASLAIAAIVVGLPKSAGFEMPAFWLVAVFCLIVTAVLSMVAMIPASVTMPAESMRILAATNLDSERLQLLIAASLYTTERRFKSEIDSKARTVYIANGATVLAIVLLAVGAWAEL